MAYRDRGQGITRGGMELDEGRFETDPGRRNRSGGRGYGEDYRGYSRGYNVSNEPNYRTEYDEGFTGYGRGYDENYGRESRGQNRWPSSESGRWETPGRGLSNRRPSRSHLRARDIMTRNVTTCRRDTPILEVARIMRDQDVGAVPVIGENGKLEGIVTDRDIVVSGLNSDKNENELRAEDCMSTDLFTANQNDRLVEVIREMGDHQVRRVPVVDGHERLVGIISMADVAVQTDKDAELADALEEISGPSSFFGRLARWFS